MFLEQMLEISLLLAIDSEIYERVVSEYCFICLKNNNLADLW